MDGATRGGMPKHDLDAATGSPEQRWQARSEHFEETRPLPFFRMGELRAQKSDRLSFSLKRFMTSSDGSAPSLESVDSDILSRHPPGSSLGKPSSP